MGTLVAQNVAISGTALSQADGAARTTPRHSCKRRPWAARWWRAEWECSCWYREKGRDGLAALGGLLGRLRLGGEVRAAREGCKAEQRGGPLWAARASRGPR